MPIPIPHKQEKQEKFIHRCMSNETMKKEYKDTNQRYAVCMSSWRKKKKTKGEKQVAKLENTWTVVGIEKNQYDGEELSEYCTLKLDNNRIHLGFIPSFVTEIGQRVKMTIEDATIKLEGK